MHEKEFTFNNATLVWWYIAWRALAVGIVLKIVVAVTLSLSVASEFISGLAAWAVILITIFIQVFFIRMAVNRDYRSKANGTFRLAALEIVESDLTNEVPVDSGASKG